MKQQKRLGYKVGIGLIILSLGYIFWSHSTEENRVQNMAFFATIVLFIFTGYFRIYQFYKLEKIQKIHNKKDFLEYFDNMDFYLLGLKHIILPRPILQKFPAENENKIRTAINILTILFYLTFVLLISLSNDFY